jgi:hypothetical protein
VVHIHLQFLNLLKLIVVQFVYFSDANSIPTQAICTLLSFGKAIILEDHDARTLACRVY